MGDMRIVLDTDVLVAGLISPRGASRALLNMAFVTGGIRPVISVPLLMEYETVLTRQKILAQTRLSVNETGQFLDDFCAIAKPAQIHFAWRPQLIDPGDELVLEAAINGRAQSLVTFNHRHMRPAFAFGIPLATPGQLLHQLRQMEENHG